MPRIAHVSDLHFGEASPGRIAALSDDIRASAPDAVVISGDLTRRALRAEFEAAFAFLDGLGAPLLVVPGNHDIPRLNLYSRLLHPRRRWLAARPPASPDVLQLEGVSLIGLDTVSRAQWHLDWAAGAVSETRLRKLEQHLQEAAGGLIVVVCHHPLHHAAWAHPRRTPRNARAATELLRRFDVSALLCGHLHRADISTLGAGGPVQIVAPSALSPRGQGMPNGWNLITVESGALTMETREFDGVGWRARPVPLT